MSSMIDCLNILAQLKVGEWIGTGVVGTGAVGLIVYLLRTLARQNKTKLWLSFGVGGNGSTEEKDKVTITSGSGSNSGGVCPAHEGLIITIKSLHDTQRTLLDGQNIMQEEMQRHSAKLDAILDAANRKT